MIKLFKFVIVFMVIFSVFAFSGLQSDAKSSTYKYKKGNVTGTIYFHSGSKSTGTFKKGKQSYTYSSQPYGSKILSTFNTKSGNTTKVARCTTQDKYSGKKLIQSTTCSVTETTIVKGKKTNKWWQKSFNDYEWEIIRLTNF